MEAAHRPATTNCLLKALIGCHHFVHVVLLRQSFCLDAQTGGPTFTVTQTDTVTCCQPAAALISRNVWQNPSSLFISSAL